eukprot:CAMPEP_0185571542 /NCGR_PEP_ID=MMETSP0434-20130131/3585_1 /TAXON_ID=626734 ORGANISM="Favella taraikaensis, Strain Fe Narragansett Bay" /NCGR_SAMPLE_ID=MMETSP0434 /ASSEMBLY_ACC=CAM_ASM_000379 /LENGTH=88 /DNA_ID=CAMNT_0028187029 /DNA_START=583 /DNA_END=848 /DNA_ORIENTATION=-
MPVAAVQIRIVDEAGRDGIETDAEGCELKRRSLREHFEAGVAHAIANHAGLTAVALIAADIDDATARLLQQLEEELRQDPRRPHVNIC